MLGLVPQAGRGAFPNAFPVEPAFNPLGAVASAIEAIPFEPAIGGVAGENKRIHFGFPTSAVECHPNGEMGQIFGRLLPQQPFGHKTVTIRSQKRPRFLARTGKLLHNKRFRCGGGGGSRTRVRNRCQPGESMLCPLPHVFACIPQNGQDELQASPMISRKTTRTEPFTPAC